MNAPLPRENALSRREREIMNIVFALGKATAAQIREGMADPPTDAAVRATLRILVGKGFLKHEYDGPRYVYSPTIPRDKARRSALKRLVETFFDDSVEEAMVALLEMDNAGLKPDERERIKRLIERARAEGR